MSRSRCEPHASDRPDPLPMCEQLAELWQPFLRRGDGRPARTTWPPPSNALRDTPGERLVVAEYDGEFAGAVFLKADDVLAGQPRAGAPGAQRARSWPTTGAAASARRCWSAAVTWAEELGIGHVATAAAVRLTRGQPLHGPPRARAAGGAPDGADPGRARQALGALPGRAARSRRCSPYAAACAARARSPAAEAQPGSPVARHQGAGDPAGAHPLAALVGDHDLVRRHGAPQVQRRSPTPVTRPLRGGPVVGGVDVDADREPVGVGVDSRAERAQALGEHHRGAAVEQPVGLGVALDRHRRDDAGRRTPRGSSRPSSG